MLRSARATSIWPRRPWSGADLEDIDLADVAEVDVDLERGRRGHG